VDELTPPDRSTRLTFRPDRRLTALAGFGVLVAVALILVTDDSAGRLLYGLAGVALLGYVLGDLLYSPRLVVDRDGLIVNAPLSRVRLPWTLVYDIHEDTRIRMGLRSTTLEIDANETLVVLSRRAIGADPGEAALLIRAVDPR
jgi:hypothetical protein